MVGSQSEVRGESLDAVQADVPILQVRTERGVVIKLTGKVCSLLKGRGNKAQPVPRTHILAPVAMVTTHPAEAPPESINPSVPCGLLRLGRGLTHPQKVCPFA